MAEEIGKSWRGIGGTPTLLERTYEILLEAIRVGKLEAGSRINQDELAERLDISRQPVGQALSLLRSQGFVRDNGRRGLVVTPIEPATIRSIYELREALDPMAARLAAGRCLPKDAREGRRLLGERSGSPDKMAEADRQLHVWMSQLSGNALLVEVMRLFWTHLHRVLVRRPDLCAAAEHDAIVESIAARDGERAAETARLHVVGALARFEATIDSAGTASRRVSGLRRRGA